MTDLSEAHRIYVVACHLPPAEREQLLERECGVDEGLRRMVEQLLVNFDAPIGDLESPTFAARGAADTDAGATLQGELADRVRELIGAEPDGAGGAGRDEASGRLRALVEPDPEKPRYEVVREIGRGGMGAVFEVVDAELDRKLAMKVITLGGGGKETPDADALSPAVVHRFLDEAQVTAQLDHPGIVPVHEVGVDAEGRLYYTMPLVRGRNLAEVFRCVPNGDDGWTLPRVIGVLQNVCEAMAYAHSRGVVHRDLKPANVMVGPFGEVYVMDWGLAKVLADARSDGAPQSARAESSDARAGTRAGSSRTLHGQILGTPGYLAPEQARGDLDRVGPRSDVYAVGAMLYHLLAGHPPYADPRSRDRRTSALERVVNDDPPPPIATVAPDAPPELVAVCERAMAPDPSRRYDGMRALADDLRAWGEGRVVRAHEQGAMAELRKWVLRNRGLAASLVAALVLLIAAPTVVMLREAQNARALERKNDEVTREAETSRQVTQFLVNMFEAQDPRQARGGDVTVREILDREAPRVVADLGEEPLVRSRLLECMGSLYLSLGLTDDADPLLAEAHRARGLALGEDHPETLGAARSLGLLRAEQGRFEEARRLIEPALRELRDSLGDEHVETLKTCASLATVRFGMGDAEGGEALLEEASQGYAAALGSRHETTLRSIQALTVVYDRLGRFQEAEELLRTVLDSSRSELGPDHPDTLTATDSLATCLAGQGQLDEAEELFELAVAGRRAVLGEHHPTTLISVNNATGVLGARGRDEEAAAAYLALLEQARATLGEEHPFTLQVRNNLGGASLTLHRLDVAETHLTAALEGRRRVLGDAHPDTLDTLSRVASLRQQQGRFEEAELMHLETLEGRRAVYGEDHGDTLESLNNFALVRLQLGEVEEATALFRDVLSRQAARLGDHHQLTLTTLHNLAEATLRLGHADEAEALHRRALKGRRRSLGDDHPDTLASLSRLGLICWQHGQLEEAESYCRDLIDGCRSALGPDHPGTIQALRSLSRVHWSAEEVDAASARHREAVAEAERAFGPTHAMTLEFVADLAYELHRRGRNEEAEPLARRALEGTPEGSPAAAVRADLLLRIRGGAQ